MWSFLSLYHALSHYHEASQLQTQTKTRRICRFRAVVPSMATRSEIWTSQLNRDHYTFLLQPCAARESADMIAAEERLSMFSHQAMLLPAFHDCRQVTVGRGWEFSSAPASADEPQATRHESSSQPSGNTLDHSTAGSPTALFPSPALLVALNLSCGVPLMVLVFWGIQAKLLSTIWVLAPNVS